MWTGKKTLNVNGTPAEKFNKNEFKVGEEIYNVKGSALTGVKLINKSDVTKQIVLARNTWWECILIFLPWVWWGVTLVPLIGGWIWSLLAAVFVSMINALVLRSEMNLMLKLTTCIIMLFVAFLAWAGLTYLFTELLI